MIKSRILVVQSLKYCRVLRLGVKRLAGLIKNTFVRRNQKLSKRRKKP
ncbi:hypothetical protein [Metallosphaera hakonensis]|nr:hypothetical protein [Metallosphaera hakonensis]